MASRRIHMMNKHIGKIFAGLLEGELSLKPGVMITIAKVDTTSDLRFSKVSLSVFPEAEESYAMTAVRNHLPHLQKLLHAKLTMKIRPRIGIVTDHTEQKADEVEKLLREIQHDDQSQTYA